MAAKFSTSYGALPKAGDSNDDYEHEPRLGTGAENREQSLLGRC